MTILKQIKEDLEQMADVSITKRTLLKLAEKLDEQEKKLNLIQKAIGRNPRTGELI